MKPRHRRMMLIVAAVGTFSVAVILVLFAFQKNLVFFFTPSQVMAHEAPQGRPFRVGGMVTTGSLKRLADGVSVQFSVTDTAQTMNVVYKGVLPDLFKEGKGVVVEGALQGEAFVASQVLAKHDENYMPPEAADALKKAQETNARATQTLAPLAKP
ncbi:MAG: cytochrome c maturation protein CcmE [Betaproteobacteria bacterium]